MKGSLFIAALAASLFGGSAMAQDNKTETAIFAGGCFWCMHAAFEGLEGVTRVLSGYSGGDTPNPTYEAVSTGQTGHIEVIQVTYDPARVGYAKLLEYFWDNVDPTDPNGQFCDKGSQYLAGIFYMTDAQKAAATESIAAVEKKLGRNVATFLRPAKPFYAAEDYHQSYHKKNPIRYNMYKSGCGRDEKLEEIWKK